MSKQGKRKITAELSKSKDVTNRPSVFERLGIKKAASNKKTAEICRQWAQHGTCAYGKSCKFATTHVLISPSKQRAANKDSELKKPKDDSRSKLLSTVVVRSDRSPDSEIDNWDQNDLEYADTDVLEKRRQELQRELELQLKMDTNKDMKDKKKVLSSSSSSRSSSSSSASSSSSEGSSSSSSSSRVARKKAKKGKQKRNSSSSSDNEGPSKKKYAKTDTSKRDASKSDTKKGTSKDDKSLKKQDTKKKSVSKTLGKKSLSPVKKSGGTPPINSKSIAKVMLKHSKSPAKRDKIKSLSPSSNRSRTKDRDKDKEKERDKERNKGRSRSPRKARSKSPRRHNSPRRKGSIERLRLSSPKKNRKDGSTDRPKKVSPVRERGRDKKASSLERRKDKHDDKDRHDRKSRARDRNKDTKRDDSKRRGRERGLARNTADKGLEKPNKPMERLLPRPEERLAALAAITNRNLDTDKGSTISKDRQEGHPDRGPRKQDRDRDRSNKRDHGDGLDPDNYEMGLDRGYERDHYDRGDDRYPEPQDGDRSPGYARDRHYENYDMPGPSRGYPEDEERLYGYEERRHRERSWEGGRAGSLDRERGYMHPHKEWEGEEYRGGDWPRDVHWPMHDNQRGEWVDKEQDMENWHRRGPPPHRGRINDNVNRGNRVEANRGDANKRRNARPEEPVKESVPVPVAPRPETVAPRPEPEVDPVPDDLSEISDDPDDILNRDDIVDPNMDNDSQAPITEEPDLKVETLENRSTTQETNSVPADKDLPEQKDENDTFEEISDGELEEERTRGLGDALGVDWASLVAEVRRGEQPTNGGGARERWRADRVLARLGLAREHTGAVNGEDHKDVALKPVPCVQTAQNLRDRQRAMLFGVGCELRLALSARRDLALRRLLCRLPPADRAPPATHPAVHASVRALLCAPSAGGT